MHRSTGFRKGKKPRKRREPWYGRAKRRRARYKASTYQPQFTFDDEAYDDWYWSHRHKFLHVDHYGHDFGELCRRMSDEELDLLLFGSHAFFSRAAPKRCDWGFLDLQVPLSVQNPTIRVSGPSAVYDCFQAFYTGSQAGNDLPIVFDTGATISVSPYVEDFEDLATKDLSGLSLRGITAKTSVQGAGTVNWHVRDDSGIIHSIRTRAYYIPNAAARLFSPLAYFRQEENMKKGGAFVFEDRGGYFAFPRTNGKSRLTFNIDHEFPLPISRPERPLSLADKKRDSVFLNVTAPENTNLTPAQKELLRWHFKLGHVNMSWLQKLMRVREGEKEPVIPTVLKASLCSIPLCAACQYGKAHLRTKPGAVEVKEIACDGILWAKHTTPGHFSVDQFVSSTKGRLLHTHGKEKEDEHYTGGTLYVDEASSMVFCILQGSLNAAEMLTW